MLKIDLWHCDVWQTEKGVAIQHVDPVLRTPIGILIEGHPHHTPHYFIVAHRCGYGDNIFQFAVEHDLFHAWVAEHFLGQPSNVLWKLAHGTHADPTEAAQEEIWVQTIQAWVQANVRPIVGGVDWDQLKTDALGMLRQFYQEG